MGKIMALKNYYDALFIEALFAFSDACLLYKTEIKNMSKSAAMGDCAREKERFDNELRKYESAFHQVYNECRNNVRKNVENMVVKVLSRHGHNFEGDRLGLTTMIRDSIETDYFWMDAVVSVYDEVKGDHKHQHKNVAVWKRENGHNVIVMMEPKKSYWANTDTISKSRFDKVIMDKAINPITNRHDTPNAKTLLERIYTEGECTSFGVRPCRVTVISDAGSVGGGATLATSNNQRYTYIYKFWRWHYGRPSWYFVIISVGWRRFMSKLIFSGNRISYI